MEIQQGKEGMKTQKFNSDVGATGGCTPRLLLNMIPRDKQSIKHGIRADAWFRSVKMVSEVSRHGHEAVFQVKQYHSLFLKAFIEDKLKDAPGEVHIALEGKTQCEVTLIAVFYSPASSAYNTTRWFFF
jgi:hypothetical protein